MACEANSAGKRPLSWRQLLEEMSRSLVLVAESRAYFDRLIESGHLLEAAEFCEHEARLQGKLLEIRKVVRECTDGPKGGQFSPLGNGWIEAISELNPQIVLTTNFDKLLDANFDRHSYTSGKLGSQIRLGESVIVKLHGTVEEIDDIVLSQSSYASVRQRGSHVFEVTQALLMTKPCLFVGYSLGDPDIQLLLENVMGAGREPTGHYALLEDALMPYQVERLSRSYGITPVLYEKGNHNAGARLLMDLAQFARPSVD